MTEVDSIDNWEILTWQVGLLNVVAACRGFDFTQEYSLCDPKRLVLSLGDQCVR